MLVTVGGFEQKYSIFAVENHRVAAEPKLVVEGHIKSFFIIVNTQAK
jgi:hypothetical protein